MQTSAVAASSRRAGVVAVLAALVLVVLAAPVVSAPVLDSGISASALARQAAGSADGARGGQCKAFVNRVFNSVAEATGSDARIGSSYYSDYLAVGGLQVSVREARRGDVIQLNAARTPDVFFAGMHTAMILRVLGPDDFLVIDSNWRHDELVRRHEWRPGPYAARLGLAVHFWRLGTTSPGSASAPVR